MIEMKSGVACSPGVAIEKAYLLEEPKLIIASEKIEPERVGEELGRLTRAIEISKEQLQEVYRKTLLSLGEEDAKIIEAHQMILEDPFFQEEICNAVKHQLSTAEHAIHAKVEEQVAMFEAIDDPYIRERAADIRDVGKRLLMNTLGIEIKDISCLERDAIVVGHELTPSMMATLDRKHVKGIVAEVGGATAHTAILARNLEIPAILGAAGVLSMVRDGQLLLMNGSSGELEVEPDDEKIAETKRKMDQAAVMKRELSAIKNLKSKTTDGHSIELVANIGLPADTEKALEYGAEGVGLFRTEFLYMDRNGQPDEEEQFEAYKKVLEDMAGKPVIIRTLDIGGDKEISYFNFEKEENPFLGYRAIRICLEDTELFKTQLRAILRASAFGNALIMFPMISGSGEVATAKSILEDAKAELRAKQQAFSETIRVGIMVEIPSAAVLADQLAEEVDFFSIGTNDLTQYTLAVDRGNRKVSNLYNSFHPALLRLFKTVIDASENKGRFTGMCGELAGNPLATLLLLGMGFHELSMSPGSILRVKKIVTSVSMKQAREIARRAMEMKSAEEIETCLREELIRLKLADLIDL